MGSGHDRPSLARRRANAYLGNPGQAAEPVGFFSCLPMGGVDQVFLLGFIK
jgi:hypothetical protein